MKNMSDPPPGNTQCYNHIIAASSLTAQSTTFQLTSIEDSSFVPFRFGTKKLLHYVEKNKKYIAELYKVTIMVDREILKNNHISRMKNC